jgi:hypothetical protein
MRKQLALLSPHRCDLVETGRRFHMTRKGSLAVLLVALGTLVSAPGAEAQEKFGTWSGYIWQTPQPPAAPITFTAVRAKWTQPSVFCTKPNARVSFWVGLDNSTVEQAGTVAVCGDAAAPLYYKAFWEMYAGADSSGGEPFTVSPGDSIEAFVGYTNGSYVLQLNDLTNGRSLSTIQACSPTVVCKNATAEWIVERPGGGAYPLADYGIVEFSNIVATSSGSNVVRSEIDMVHAGVTLSTCRPVSPVLPQPGPPLTAFVQPLVTFSLAFTCNWLAAE